MKLNLVKVVVDYLKARPDEKFTARQIADWVFATYTDECQAKKDSSHALETDADLVQQIVREISSQMPRLQKKLQELKMTEGRPRKFISLCCRTATKWRQRKVKAQCQRTARTH